MFIESITKRQTVWTMQNMRAMSTRTNPSTFALTTVYTITLENTQTKSRLTLLRSGSSTKNRYDVGSLDPISEVCQEEDRKIPLLEGVEALPAECMGRWGCREMVVQQSIRPRSEAIERVPRSRLVL